MGFDEERLASLVEESQDMQSESTRLARAAVPALRDLAHERGETDPDEMVQFATRRRFLRRSLLVTRAMAASGAVGATVVGLLEAPAYAQTTVGTTPTTSPDIQVLQTAASIEVLAISTYNSALNLAYVGGATANAAVKNFVTTTLAQHKQHLASFNNQATALGGAAQNNPDPAYVSTVNSAVSALAGQTASAGLLSVVKLATTLETIAAQTYVSDVTALSSATARQLMASIMGIEAQHVAFLLVVTALLSANAGADVALPPPLSALPASAGSAGFPNAVYPTSMAAPAAQGAVSS
ncbi:MAG: ferritin-like domain-containing protein [Acidimicrobiales bacterium]